MKKKLIPFGMLPASWGLKGKSRRIAEAEYYLEGHELAKTLCQIEHEGSKALPIKLLEVDYKHGLVDDYTFAKAECAFEFEGAPNLQIELLRVEHDYGKIDDYQFAVKSAELTLEGDALALRKLEIDLAAGLIDQTRHDKETANIKKEPWITIINSGFNAHEGIEGLSFEFDWNTHWIETLIQNGYVGMNEEHIVQQWFDDVCRSNLLEAAQQNGIPFNSQMPMPPRRNGRDYT